MEEIRTDDMSHSIGQVIHDPLGARNIHQPPNMVVVGKHFTSLLIVV